MATLTPNLLRRYEADLRSRERSSATVERYLREARHFAAWLDDTPVTREKCLAYKEILRKSRRATGANTALAALNSLFAFAKLPDCRLQALRAQRRVFCDERRELTATEYARLVAAAEKIGNDRLSLLLQTLAATGIRVSELRAITVEAVATGRAEVRCKGKTREILLPRKLCKKLQKYLKKRRITNGAVFVTRTGNPLDRSNIWAEMKRLCERARVDARKVFPHNLRHLFARKYYAAYRDLAKLADLLGHSSVNTTRIYTIESGREHARQIDALGFVT